MAKKDAYYFSHDCNAQDDPKCMMLIDDLGMEGYGIFWALIEKLRSEKDYTLPVSICGRFARRWATSEAKIQAVVLQYGLFEIDNEIFFSLRLKRSMEERSSKARISAESRWGKNQQVTEQNPCDRIAIVYDSNAIGMRDDAIKGKERERKEKGNTNTLPEKSGEREISEKEKRFEKFWELYERKGNKQSAKKSFMKLSEAKLSEIAKKVIPYIESTPDKQYRLDAEKYLNETKEHWNDEIRKPIQTTNGIISQTEQDRRAGQFNGGKVSKLKIIDESHIYAKYGIVQS